MAAAATTIRPYRPGDESAILSTFNLVFREVNGPGFVDRGLDVWRWIYSRNPEAKNAPVKRYKGLGEMNPGELRETTMHPASRVLKQVTLEEADLANEVVADLMDESRPDKRREFLAQAARVTDLDI